jgi:hypothetical protein
MDMLIKANGKYVIISQDSNNLIHQWNLTIVPGKRAWKLVNKDIKVGDVLNGYKILAIKTVYEPPTIDLDDDEWWKRPISRKEFDMSVYMSGIGFAVEPCYEASYRCQICGGVVANDICTQCMFDWDN